MWAEATGGLGAQAAGHLARQQTLPGQRDTGAVVRADWGTDDAGGTAGLAALALWLHLLRRRPEAPPVGGPDDATLLVRLRLALDYLERAQRPSGLTDLRDCNYDSGPDAGFVLQTVCPPLLLARETPPAPEWAPEAARLERFARRMAEGAIHDGGFHTPNHRWVISGALALAGRLFPDLPVRPVIDAYMAEGIDQDADGFYIERSAGVYDAICARSLLLLARCVPEYATVARAAVVRNLHADLFLLNADGTVETGLSHRQDNGTVPLASNLAVPYLWASLVPKAAEHAAVFRAAAGALWDATPPERRDYYGLSQVLLTAGGPPEDAPTPLPDSFARHFAANGLWRVRRGALSASFFRDAGPRLLNARFGRAYLGSASVHQSYFGVGQFLADEMEVTPEDGVRLLSRGERNPRRPGYDLPLGRPVPPEEFLSARAERGLRRVSPAASELTAREIDGGFELRWRTLGGMDRVTAQIAFDFAPGGIWETGDTCLRPEPGQVLFLKGGHGTMWYGDEAIRIGPGSDAHRMWQMRDAAPPAAPRLVRVLITFETPADHAFTITGGAWPWPAP
jgi:hypothetical protein